MTDRDQGVAAILLFLAAYVAPYIAHYIIPPSSRRRAAISGFLVGAAVPGIAAVIYYLAGVNLPVSAVSILLFVSAVLGMISGLRGHLDAPRIYDRSRLIKLSDPFYADLMEGEKPADFDRDNKKTIEQAKGVGYIGGAAGGGSAGGFSGGGGFGGGGASGGW
jgi:uncharacterized membrane protein YgcG